MLASPWGVDDVEGWFSGCALEAEFTGPKSNGKPGPSPRSNPSPENGGSTAEATSGFGRNSRRECCMYMHRAEYCNYSTSTTSNNCRPPSLSDDIHAINPTPRNSRLPHHDSGPLQTAGLGVPPNRPPTPLPLPSPPKSLRPYLSTGDTSDLCVQPDQRNIPCWLNTLPAAVAKSLAQPTVICSKRSTGRPDRFYLHTYLQLSTTRQSTVSTYIILLLVAVNRSNKSPYTYRGHQYVVPYHTVP